MGAASLGGIFGGAVSRASSAKRGIILSCCILLLAACGGRRRAEPAPLPGESGTTLGTLPAAAVLELEVAGAQPSDTTVTAQAGVPRTVVVRHGFPDNAVFAEVRFDSLAFAGGSDVTISVRPLPGLYGVTIETSRAFTSAQLTFHYAVHFLAPAEARVTHGSNIAFERTLAIGRLEAEQVAFMTSHRPGTDLLRATISQPGTYLVAAPR